MSVAIEAEKDIKALVVELRKNLLNFYRSNQIGNAVGDVEVKVHEDCAKLEYELTDQWNKNLKKVELFVHRNLLDSRSGAVADAESQYSELNEVSQNVDSLLKRNIELIALKSQLTNECELGEALLNDLSANVFQVKRSMQSFETHNVALDTTCEIFSKQATRLEEKRVLASDMCKEMTIFWEKYNLNSSLGDILTDDSIIEALRNHLSG